MDVNVNEMGIFILHLLHVVLSKMDGLHGVKKVVQYERTDNPPENDHFISLPVVTRLH